jgi:hypothetical protein
MSTLSVSNLSDLAGGTNINLGGGIPEKLVQMTAQSSTSGTAIDFTGIPSWAKKITVMFNGVSTNGTSPFLIQIGGASVENTGYNAYSITITNANGVGGQSSTAGFVFTNGLNASYLYGGSVVFSTLDSGNIWVCNGQIASGSAGDRIHIGSGNKTLSSGPLARVRITTVNGTDLFDAGSINIIYEG